MTVRPIAALTVVGVVLILHAAVRATADVSPQAASPVPGFSIVAAPAGGGSLLGGVFPSASAPQPLRSGLLYLPPHFDRSVRYPVVYLLHGMPGAPGEYASGLDVRGVADRLISTGRVRPFIAVMPAAGPTVHYDGEWTGPWERYLVSDVVPWVDRNLPTLATPAGRTIAGLSAGGYGAADIGLRSPQLFGRIASWSGYFHPLHDGSLAHASRRTLLANDAFRLAALHAGLLRARGLRFFVSTGPSHSHWFSARQTVDFVAELRRLRLPVASVFLRSQKGAYETQLIAGLRWALARRPA